MHRRPIDGRHLVYYGYWYYSFEKVFLRIEIIILLRLFNVTDNLKNGRFHQHLRDTFSPMVVRYVDLMENSIAQSIHKGFERERWENKG